MTSYQLSQRFDIHSILFYGVALPLYRAAVAIDAASKALRAALPHLLFALALLAKVLGLVACVVGCAFLALAFWVVLAKLLGGLLIIGAFGWATFPRTKAVR